MLSLSTHFLRPQLSLQKPEYTKYCKHYVLNKVMHVWHTLPTTYLVLVLFVFVTQIPNETYEVRLEPISHTGDVACVYTARGTEEVSGVFPSYMNQS